MNKPTTLILLTFVFFLSACDGISDSEDIRTSGLHATIKVTANEDDLSEVSVRLRVGDSQSETYLQLTNGDRLQAILNDSTTENISIKDGSYYRGSFSTPGAGQGNASYRVSFNRPNDTDAPNSVVTMPSGLSGFTTSPTDVFSRSTEILMLSWNATAENLLVPVRITGNCINHTTVQVISSTGIFAVNPLTLSSNSTPEQNCEVTFTASLTNSGTVDLAYEEGGVITPRLAPVVWS